MRVKGKLEPVEIATLIGARSEKLAPDFLQLLDIYEEALKKFRTREFGAAKALFLRFAEAYPHDFLAGMYLERAHEFELEPPDDDWDATEIFNKK